MKRTSQHYIQMGVVYLSVSYCCQSLTTRNLVWTAEASTIVSASAATNPRREISTTRIRRLDDEEPYVDPKSCKDYGKKTCTPSRSPSVAPSVAPSISAAPSLSAMPSTRPSLSSRPSVAPTRLPSFQPSISPTERPSVQPSQAPTPVPSSQPSALPSVDPNGYYTRIITNENGESGVVSTCRRSIENTEDQYEQQINFHYELQMEANGKENDQSYYVFLAMDYIASQIQRQITPEALNCAAAITDPENSTASVRVLSSLPVDIVQNKTAECANTTDTNRPVDCWMIDAAMMATIYQPQQRRRQQERNTKRILQSTDVEQTITDADIYQLFQTAISNAFANASQWSGGVPNVVEMEYMGISNADLSDDEDDESSEKSERSVSSGGIAGIVIATLVFVALLVALILCCVTRHKRNTKRRSRDKNDITRDSIMEYDDEDDQSAMLDRSRPPENYEFEKVLFVQEQDERDESMKDLDEESDVFDLATLERTKASAQERPIEFIRTNADAEQQQAALRLRILEEMGTINLPPPHGRRQYGTPDTLDL